MIRDLHLAWRQFLRRPLLGAAAVLTLAIGTGASTTLFSLMNALLLRPLPLDNAAALVSITMHDTTGASRGMSDEMLQALAARSDVLSSAFGYIGGGPVTIAVDAEDFRGGIEIASGQYFQTLGLRPALGRFFAQGDSGQRVTVVSDRFWRRALNAEPGAIDRTIKVEGVPLQIIGVAPAPFTGLQVESRGDCFVLDSTYLDIVGEPAGTPSTFRSVMARLRDDVSIDRARAALDAAWPSILTTTMPPGLPASQHDAYLARRPVVDPASTGFSFLRDRYASSLRLLMWLTVGMLLVASLNISAALLAGAAARQQEFRLRMALGASRGRLVRQLLAEGVLVAVLGTLAGLPLAIRGTPALFNLLWPSTEPLPVSLAPDWRVLVSIATVLVIVTLLAALAPAWLGTRRSVAPGLSRAVVRGHRRSQRGMLVGEIALAFVLLTGAGLFIRTLVVLREMPLGFDVRGVLSVSLGPRPGSAPDTEAIQHAAGLADEVAHLPGIAAAGFISHGLMLGKDNQIVERVTASAAPVTASDPTAMIEHISPGFFDTVSMKVERGRDFAWRDDLASARVAIVSATEAARLFPDEDAVGRHIRVGSKAVDQDITIVGVVADSRLEDLRVPHPAVVFLSLAQEADSLRWGFLHVRSSRDEAAAAAVVRSHVMSHARQTVEGIRSVAGNIDIALTRERLAAFLGAAFASLAIGLLAIGIFGLLSQWVTERTRELGLRLALGESPVGLARRVVGQAAGLAAAGAAIGAGITLLAGRLADASVYLFGASWHDPLVLSGAAALLVLVGIVASLGPARRVQRIDPIVALRAE